jgi:hypothetical protein
MESGFQQGLRKKESSRQEAEVRRGCGFPSIAAGVKKILDP